MFGNRTVSSGQSIRVFTLTKRDPNEGRGSADVVFIVDESRSMTAEHRWLKDMVQSLDESLRGDLVGVKEPNRYALIGFANPNPRLERGQIIELSSGSDPAFGTPSQFAAGVDKLAERGDNEDGYAAMAFALTSLAFRERETTARQFILVTDEERDDLDKLLTYRAMLDRLSLAGVKLNVVVKHLFAVSENGRELWALGLDSDKNAYTADGRKLSRGFPFPDSGYETTYADYVEMAFAREGGAWDLNQLRTNDPDIREAFTKAFVQVKVEEIVQQLNGTCEQCTCIAGEPSCFVVRAATRENQCHSGVVEDLEVNIFPASSVKKVGDEASFACIVSNVDLVRLPSITWKPIPSNAFVRRNNLVFSSVTLENEGRYTCEARTATGRYGKATVSMTVIDPTTEPLTELLTPSPFVIEVPSSSPSPSPFVIDILSPSPPTVEPTPPFEIGAQ